MSMGVLKSILFCVFLFSLAFFAASDDLDQKPQDIQKIVQGSGALGQQPFPVEVQKASTNSSRNILGGSGKESELTADLLQFTAGGHVLGFRKGEMFVASGDHALRVKFVNARPVLPGGEAKSGDPESSRPTAQPLGKVSYPNLWDGVTLVYENHGSGVVKSTYRVEPVGNSVSSFLNQIRLRYDVPVKVDDDGSLVFSFPTGEMRESRPVAWQEIEGNRVPVEATYRLIREQEVGFKAESYDPRYPLVIDPVLTWNTFLGGLGTDYAGGIAVDTSGNVYITGNCTDTWGSPVRPFSAGVQPDRTDAFVAKLNSSGALQWNTFLGTAYGDNGNGIAVDTSGNVYVTGFSDATWGSPVRPFIGGDFGWGSGDAYAAKLNGNGILQWNTFLGGWGSDTGVGIAVDSSGNIYVTGSSFKTWGKPIRAWMGYNDVFVAKLDGGGNLQWNTFLGGYTEDFGCAIVVDKSGNYIYVAGWSYSPWGSPIRPFTGDGSNGSDVFAAKLNSFGGLEWSTFLGGSNYDGEPKIAIDTSENVYVAGWSWGSWGTPVRPFSGSGAATGDYNAFAAKLYSSGALVWNTFLGAGADLWGQSIAVDASGNVYVAGMCKNDWGLPTSPKPGLGDYDAYVALLNGSGALQWNTYLGGSSEDDWPEDIAVDTSGNVYVAGSGGAAWGSPVRPFSGDADAWVAKLSIGVVTTVTPTVTTTAASSITATSALSGGTVTSDGGVAVTARGVCIGTSPNPTTANNHTHDGTGIGAFTSSLTSATPGTTYHVRAYATNSVGTAYGSDLTFTTLSLAPVPTVTTTAISSLTKTSLVTGGNVTSAGLAAVTARGVCIGTSANPTTANNHTHDGTGIGAFTSTLTSATPGTTYHIRAYATNSMGTSYGNDRWFRMLGGTKTDFNGDGKEDLLWRNFSTGENYIWYLGYSATAMTAPQAIDSWGMFRDIAPSSKFSRETNPPFQGKAVTIYRSFEEGARPGKTVQTPEEGLETLGLEQATQMLRNPFEGLMTTFGVIRIGGASAPPLTDFNWKIVGTGNINGDGKTYILLRNSVSGEIGVWYMNGGTRIGAEYLPTMTDLNWHIVGTGDFNGDGKPDIVWRNSVTGENAIWYMNGKTRIRVEYLLTVTDLTWQIVGTGDFNGDGKADILWRNSVNGDNYIWCMEGATRIGLIQPPSVTDLTWQIVATGDYNQDGKFDIIWRNTVTGENAVWYMNGATRIGVELLLTVADLSWRIVNH